MSLYPFQKTGVEYLWQRRRAYLADEMGLGKTPQVIVAANLLDTISARPSFRVLVLCPAIAVPVWEREWLMWEGTGTLEVVSYPWLALHPEYVHEKKSYHDLVILDEAQFCKSMDAKRTRAALVLASWADHAWCLSGTPLQNHFGELYPVIRALFPHVLPRGVTSYDHFLDHFCETIDTPYGLKVLKLRPERLVEAKTITDRIMLRRVLDEVEMELPPLRWESVPLPKPTAEQMALVSDVIEAMGNTSYRAITQALDRGELPKEGPSVAQLRRAIGAAKAHVAADVLDEELSIEPRKIVVMAYHRDVLDVLERKLGRYGVLRVDGSTSPTRRAQYVEWFQSMPEYKVFLAQLTTASTAITLTAANEVVLVEQLWSPLDNLQVVKRIHRHGQSKPCRARQMYLSGTVDMRVIGVCNRKMKDVGQIIHV